MIEKGTAVPSRKARALIDTGASSTVISPTIADELNLVHTGYQDVTSVHNNEERPVYFGFIQFPWGKGAEIAMVSCDLRNIECLIGRDILRHWHMSYNGVDGSLVICD